MIAYAVSDLADRPEHFSDYIAQVPLPDLAAGLASQLDLAGHLDLARLRQRFFVGYAPGKWSAASVLVHLADTERVFSYRALRIARGDATALPGFDQDLFAEHDNAAGRDIDAIIAELRAVRTATIALADGLDLAGLRRSGICSGIAISAGALLFAIVGHHQHHLRVLRERYLA